VYFYEVTEQLKTLFFVNCLYMMTTDHNIHLFGSNCFKLHWPKWQKYYFYMEISV